MLWIKGENKAEPLVRRWICNCPEAVEELKAGRVAGGPLVSPLHPGRPAAGKESGEPRLILEKILTV